jgi:hypothetical protein
MSELLLSLSVKFGWPLVAQIYISFNKDYHFFFIIIIFVYFSIRATL